MCNIISRRAFCEGGAAITPEEEASISAFAKNNGHLPLTSAGHMQTIDGICSAYDRETGNCVLETAGVMPAECQEHLRKLKVA